jgi:hypothetical protein
MQTTNKMNPKTTAFTKIPSSSVEAILAPSKKKQMPEKIKEYLASYPIKVTQECVCAHYKIRPSGLFTGPQVGSTPRTEKKKREEKRKT